MRGSSTLALSTPKAVLSTRLPLPSDKLEEADRTTTPTKSLGTSGREPLFSRLNHGIPRGIIRHLVSSGSAGSLLAADRKEGVKGTLLSCLLSNADRLGAFGEPAIAPYDVTLSTQSRGPVQIDEKIGRNARQFFRSGNLTKIRLNAVQIRGKTGRNAGKFFSI